MSHLSFSRGFEEEFVNWENEVKICLQVLSGEAPHRIITIIDTVENTFSDSIGPGGTGKSWFLKRIYHIAPDRKRLDNGKLIYAIRFDWSIENYDEIAIMNIVINRLAEDTPNASAYFSSFDKAHTRFKKSKFPPIVERANNVFGADDFIVENISNVENSSINIADYILYFNQDNTFNLSIDELISLRKIFFHCLFEFLDDYPEIVLALYFDAVEKANNILGWFDSLYEIGCANIIPLNMTVFVASKTRPCSYLYVPHEKLLVIEAGYLNFPIRKKYLDKLEKNHGTINTFSRLLLLSKKSTYQEFFLYFIKCNPKR